MRPCDFLRNRREASDEDVVKRAKITPCYSPLRLLISTLPSFRNEHQPPDSIGGQGSPVWARNLKDRPETCCHRICESRIASIYQARLCPRRRTLALAAPWSIIIRTISKQWQVPAVVRPGVLHCGSGRGQLQPSTDTWQGSANSTLFKT
jgi:hypothetical protein